MNLKLSRFPTSLAGAAHPSLKFRLDTFVVGDCGSGYEHKILEFIPKLFTVDLS